MAAAGVDADTGSHSTGKAPVVPSEPSKVTDRRRRKGKFVCPVCGTVIKWKSNLRRHLRLHKDGNTHSCPRCRKRFRDATELRNHVESGVHVALKKVYTCAECGGRFPSQRLLLNHSHDKVRAFSCDICRRRFQTAVVRAAHRRRHFWRGLPRCRACCATFARVEHLARHIENHEKETLEPVRY